jgi:hypothetical protein
MERALLSRGCEAKTMTGVPVLRLFDGLRLGRV